MAGIYLIRNVLLSESLLYAAALGVGAVENGKIAVSGTGLVNLGHYRRCNQKRLLLFRVGLKELYLLPDIPLGIALLGNPALVLLYDGIGGVDNSLGRAVITLQAEHPGIRIILLEIEDILDSGSAEGIDTLGIISHYRYVLVILGQGPQNHILQIVGVLVLIDEYKLEFGLDLGKSLRVVSQKAVSVQQDIVEIHYPLLLATLLVHLVNALDKRTAGALVGLNQLRMVKILLRGDEIVLAL